MSEHLNIGGEIRRAREAAGYSVSDVENITRIPTFIIKDIEKNKFTSSGGTTYARGHIRTMAKLLNLDSNELIARFEDLTGEVDRPMIDLLSENNVTPAQNPKKKISYKSLGIAAGVVVVLSIALPAVLSFTKVHKDVTPKSAQIASNAPSQNNAVATKTTGVSVVLTGVNGQSWVGIQDAAGAQVFSGRITKGQSQTFTDSQLLNLTIGNAGAVNLVVNGKDLGTPGGVGEVVHLSFTPDQSNQG